MVSSSQATTASADASDDDASLNREASAQPEIENIQGGKTTQHDKHTKLEAMVKWSDNGQSREQPGLMFDLQYHASYNTAFFKLRASVATKSCCLPGQVSLFVFITPEAVQTMTLVSEHAQELGPDTVCLRFRLNSAEAAEPALVIPKALDPSNVAWKNKQSSGTWASLQSLVRAKNFDILCRLPRRVMSESRLQLLCEALSGSVVTSTPGYADLGGLYGGKGGKVVKSQVEVEIGYHSPNESPPAYQDVEPGPPMPPILQDKTSNKRRRGNSDTDTRGVLGRPKDGLEATVAWLVTELEEYKAREASLVNELKEVNAKVTVLISEQEQHRVKCTMLEDDLHDRVSGVEARLDELDEELDIRVDYRIDGTLDQKSDSIREELLDYMDEIMPNRIQGALEEVTFSARF